MTRSSPIDDLLRRIVPPLAAVILIAAFTALAFWQLDRAGQKQAIEDLFHDGAVHAPLVEDMPLILYKPIEASGSFRDDQQVLIENRVQDGRPGYHVVVPFEYSRNAALLLVNLGWLAKPAATDGVPAIGVSADPVTIRGRMGRLPRVGIRSGPVFAADDGWPKRARYPTVDDIAAELETDVLPFVMLLDPEPSSAYVRDWRPRESGPMTHYGYALQWFALALGVLAIAAWRWRSRSRPG